MLTTEFDHLRYGNAYTPSKFSYREFYVCIIFFYLILVIFYPIKYYEESIMHSETFTSSSKILSAVQLGSDD